MTYIAKLSEEDKSVVYAAAKDFQSFARKYLPYPTLENKELINTLAKAEVIPANYSFPGIKFNASEFKRFSNNLHHSVKVDISEEQLREWGSVSRMNLAAIKDFDPKWLDVRSGNISNRVLFGTKFPKGCDFTGVDLSGYKCKCVDFSDCNISFDQLKSMHYAYSITPPKSLRLANVSQSDLKFLSASICEDSGWKLNGEHVKGADLTPLSQLDVGKLIARSHTFEGVTFPEYSWKSPVDVDKDSDNQEFDTLQGVSFINCDLSAISGMRYWEALDSEVINTVLPSGVSYPKEQEKKDVLMDIPF